MRNNMKKNETIRDTRNKLVGNWFYNVYQGKINDSVLVISGAEMIQHKLDLKNFIPKLKVNHSHRVCYMVESFYMFPQMERCFDKNLIFTTPNGINFPVLHKTKRQILFVDVGELIEVGYLATGLEKLYSSIYTYNVAPFIKTEDFNLYYIQQCNPLEILMRNTEQLKDFLYLQLSYNRNYQYTHCKDIFFRGYDFDIEMDIKYLEDEQILTSRLAIILYKTAFLNADKNIDTLVGKFYHKHLGVKSVKCTNKHLGIDGVKGYKIGNFFNKSTKQEYGAMCQ